MSFYTSSGGPPVSEAMYNGGTQLSQNLTCGTADNYTFSLITNGIVALAIDTSQNVTFTGSVTPTGVFAAPNGTAAAPSFTFVNDLDCGIYRISTNTVGFSTAGTLALTLSATQTALFAGAVTVPAGTAGAPGLVVGSATNGLYLAAANSVGIATNGVAAIIFASTGAVSLANTIISGAGAVGAPAFQVGEATTGLYYVGASNMGISVAGVKSMEIKGLDVVIGNAAIATSATSGFLWAPSCAGAATGTPANTFTGRTPIVFDSTNGRLYAYYGGAWKYAAVAT